MTPGRGRRPDDGRGARRRRSGRRRSVVRQDDPADEQGRAADDGRHGRAAAAEPAHRQAANGGQEAGGAEHTHAFRGRAGGDEGGLAEGAELEVSVEVVPLRSRQLALGRGHEAGNARPARGRKAIHVDVSPADLRAQPPPRAVEELGDAVLVQTEMRADLTVGASLDVTQLERGLLARREACAGPAHPSPLLRQQHRLRRLEVGRDERQVSEGP